MSLRSYPPEHPDDVQMEAPQGKHTGGFVLFCMCLTGLIVYSVMARQQEKKITALTETMEATFKKMGDAFQAQGHVATSDEIAARMRANMGDAFARELKRQGGTPTSAVSASGTVPASAPPPMILQLTPDATGFSGTSTQDRAGLPPLTRVDFSFTPIGGAKFAWHNKAEKFALSFAQWRTTGDGFRAAARLTREVEGKVEDIPMDQADAYFSSRELERVAPSTRLGLAMGVGVLQGKTRPVVLIEKPINRNWSIVTGYANGGSVVMGKYTWSR